MLRDPRIFNYVLLVLYACSAVRWAVAKSLPDVIYWLCAMGLLIVTTFLYRR